MLKRLREKIFRKKFKKEEIEDTGITRISDIVSMPLREEFADDTEKQQTIDKYKKEFIKTLRLTRTITSTDIMPEELHDYKNIYLDLLMNLFEVEESEVSFDSPNDIIDEELDLSIKCFKLRLYLEHVRELIIETKLRLIALNEILNEKKLSKTRENAVLNEINNLQHSLFIFQNQEWLMIKGVHDNLINIEYIDLKTFLDNIDNPNIEEVNDEVIDKRLEEVREIALIVIPDIVGYLESLNLSPKVLIATLEQELEIYVYTHKDDLNKLREELENLASTLVPLSLEELQKEQKDYIDTICFLELRYKVFSKYGRNLVNYEDLEKLYRIKFCILMGNIFTNLNLNIMEYATHIELECYQNIIFEKINRIITGQETYLNLLADKYKINVSDIINIMVSIFKSDDEFSFLEILNNRTLLALLLSLTYCEDWLNQFFTNTYVNISDYPEVDFYQELFDWKEDIPLASVYEMKYLNIKVASFKDKNQVLEDPLYKLYCIYRNRQVKKEYMLPEGIIAIHRLKERYNAGYEIEMLDSLYYECKDKTIVMPNTLKSITGDFFKIFHNPQVVFNAELQELHQNSLSSISKFRVPNGIKVIDKNAFISNNALIIEISDYKNSSLLNDEELLKMFICNFYKAYQTSKRRSHFISDETRRKQEMYATGRYSSSDHSYLFEHDCTYTTYELKPIFNSLMVEDENGNWIILDLFDLTCECERCSLDFGLCNEYLNIYEVPTVIKHLKEQIEKGFQERKAMEPLTRLRRG